LKLIDLAKDYVLTDNTHARAIGVIAHCILYVQSGSIPAVIAWFGLAVGFVTSIGIVVNFVSGFSTVYVVGMFSMMFFETVFGGWLLLFSGRA
jgi:hypothetical protein